MTLRKSPGSVNRRRRIKHIRDLCRPYRLHQLSPLSPVDQRRADAHLCILYKIMNGLVAVSLPTYFQQTISWTCHGLSHPLTIRQIHTSFNFYKYLFFPLAVWQWNRLLSNVVLLPTLTQFSVAGTRQFIDKTTHRHGFCRQFTDTTEDNSSTLFEDNSPTHYYVEIIPKLIK